MTLSFNVPLPAMLFTVTVTLEPAVVETLAMLPEALPVLTNAKSSVDRLLTDLLKVTVKFTLVSAACAPPTGALLVTDGTKVSMA